MPSTSNSKEIIYVIPPGKERPTHVCLTNISASMFELKDGEVKFTCTYSDAEVMGKSYSFEDAPDWLHDAIEKHYENELINMAQTEQFDQPDEP